MAYRGWTTYIRWKKKKDGTYVALRRGPYRMLMPPVCVLSLLLGFIILLTVI